jgi:hypothetical protein
MCAVTVGCVKVRPIPSDRYVTTVRAGQTFTAPTDGKFVPDALFNDMLEAYILQNTR